MNSPISHTFAMEELISLHATHRIFFRVTAWVDGFQGGAYYMSSTGWKGSAGKWWKTAEEAIVEAYEIASRLKVEIDAARAEQEAQKQ